MTSLRCCGFGELAKLSKPETTSKLSWVTWSRVDAIDEVPLRGLPVGQIDVARRLGGTVATAASVNRCPPFLIFTTSSSESLRESTDSYTLGINDTEVELLDEQG